MARVRFSSLMSLCISTKPCLNPQSFQSYFSNPKFSKYAYQAHVRLSYANQYHTNQYGNFENSASARFRNQTLGSLKSLSVSSYKLSNLHFRTAVPIISLNPVSNSRSYSSPFGNKAEKSGDSGSAASVTDGVDVSDSGDFGSEYWIEKVKGAWQIAVDAASFTGQKAKEASDELIPYVDQLLNSHPYLKNVIVPVSVTVTGTVLAWVVLPRLLRRFYKYTMQGQAALLSESLSQVPYEKTFWGALEDPLRYLMTFIAFSEIGMMVAPTTVASQYVREAWRGAIIISLVWFLYRWKTNVFTRALATQSLSGFDRERFLTLDKVSSVGLFVIGLMASAEACGVAVHSILTVGGIGGVATAFAARDVLGNVLSGLSMQFSKPFSLGDTIKAGSIEGQVMEMGLTTTSLLNAEKFPVIVPNSLFSSQVIVNKSRAQWRAMNTKIPLRIEDFSRVVQISDDIKSMLRSNPKVFLGKEAPFCFLSRVENSYAELTLGCNLKQMSKDELYSTEQDILLRSLQIIKEHGATLGGISHDLTSR